jgi:hypothetical protein
MPISHICNRGPERLSSLVHPGTKGSTPRTRMTQHLWEQVGEGALALREVKGGGMTPLGLSETPDQAHGGSNEHGRCGLRLKGER